MKEEWHTTIAHADEHTVARWHTWCRTRGVKPLYIELATGGLQLMCASAADISEAVTKSGFEVVRVKHEVPGAINVSDPGTAYYYECHVKIDGRYCSNLGPDMAVSRDLYRPSRWYVTQRTRRPFRPSMFIDLVTREIERIGLARVVGAEYEACLLDTNPNLDEGWL